MMAPRPTSPVMNSVCGGGRESSVSPPSVVAPLAIKPPTLNDTQALPVPADQQQRLLYQLALAERLRLASAGLAWARPPLLAHQHHSLQESSTGSLMGGSFMSGLGFPVLGGLGSVAFGGGMIGAAASQISPAAYPPSHPLYGYRLLDPRMLLPRGPEEPKPQHSYIGLIAMAILSSPDKKLILSDIYQYILDNYPYFRTRGTGWRNSIRHNLSLNDCFMKSGRSANGKGHYWAIHPANIDDFRRGDFRRRRAQRRVRKHMGLAVDDDSEPETLSPPPPPVPTCHDISSLPSIPRLPTTTEVGKLMTRPKRQFDVLSLLAPDTPRHHISKTSLENSSDDASSMEVISADILGQSKIHLPSDPLVRVDDDLRLQLREVSDDSLSHHLSLKASCLPRNDSDSVRCGENEESSIRAHDEEVEDEEELVKVEEEEEEKYLPIFQASQRKITTSAVGGATGDFGGCAHPTREISSPLEYLNAPWHSPTSPLAVPVSNTEVHYTNPLPIISSPGSPVQQYAHEIGNSPIRSFPSSITSALGNKPILTPSTSSPFHFTHSVTPSHGHPNLSTSHINLSTPHVNLSNYTSVLPRTSQSSSSTNTHPMAVSLPQGTEIHSEP